MALVPLLDEPFAFFGHSIGAAIAYETARIIAQTYGRTATGLLERDVFRLKRLLSNRRHR
jgi:surfactin synthase thioesterase subunit